MKKLHKSKTDKKIAGVCGGIAETYDIDPTLVRIVFLATTLLSFGVGFWLYVICWIVMPSE